MLGRGVLGRRDKRPGSIEIAGKRRTREKGQETGKHRDCWDVKEEAY
jgi:hypothetical protein